MIETNKVYCMDAFELLKQLPDNSVDLVLTDPPYGITACEWDKPIDFKELWKELKRVGKENCSFVFTASQPFTTDLINSNREMFKYELIWEKSKATGHAISKIRPMKAHENIIIFLIGKGTYNPQKTEGKPYKSKLGKKESIEMSTGNVRYDNRDGKRFPRTVQYFKTSECERNGFPHPTHTSVTSGSLSTIFVSPHFIHTINRFILYHSKEL